MIFYEILLFYAFFMKNMKISNFYVFLWFYDSCDAWIYNQLVLTNLKDWRHDDVIGDVTVDRFYPSAKRGVLLS